MSEMSFVGDLVYGDLVARGKRIKTAKHWCAWANRFQDICGLKEKYGRGDVIKYLAWCREQGFCQNSINTQLRPIKLLAQIQGWDFPKLAMPKVRDSDVFRPIFSKAEAKKLIRTSKRVCDDREISYLVLSTVYGLRREEMARLRYEDIDGRLLVRTVKGGPVVKHVIPDEIREYLKDFKPYGVDYMSVVFKRILKKVGIPGGRGYGWHSIRRVLASELVLADMNIMNILRFMRWSESSMKSEFGMLAIYARKDKGAVDKKVFASHPFLKYWRPT